MEILNKETRLLLDSTCWLYTHIKSILDTFACLCVCQRGVGVDGHKRERNKNQTWEIDVCCSLRARQKNVFQEYKKISSVYMVRFPFYFSYSVFVGERRDTNLSCERTRWWWKMMTIPDGPSCALVVTWSTKLLSSTIALSLAGSCRDTAGGTAKRHQAKTKRNRKSRHTHNHRSLMIYSFVLFFFLHPSIRRIISPTKRRSI